MTEAPATIEFKTLDQLTAREAYELFKLRVDVFVAEQSTPFAELDETDAACGDAASARASLSKSPASGA